MLVAGPESESSKDIKHEENSFEFDLFLLEIDRDDKPRSKITATGSCRKEAGTSPDPAGKHRKWKQYSDRKFLDFFPVDFSRFPALSSRNRSEIMGKKSEKFPVRILLPCSSDFRCVSAGTIPYFLTWEREQELIRVAGPELESNDDLKDEENSFLLEICKKIEQDEIDVSSLNKLMKIIKDIRPCKSVIMEICHTIERIDNDVSIEYTI